MAGALFLACAVADAEPEPDLCEAAGAHVAACVGGPSAIPVDCDRDAAAELLELSCEVLDDGKADAFAGVLCDIGLLRHCRVPTCEAALPPDHDFQSEACADLVSLEGCAACDYYRCRDAQAAGQCGDDGYYLGFGYRYCLRYAQVTEPRMSDEGQAWSAANRACLIESLEANVPDSDDCHALIDAGYGTHAGCYRETGFCNLSLPDIQRVVNAIDVLDVDLRQTLEVALACVHG